MWAFWRERKSITYAWHFEFGISYYSRQEDKLLHIFEEISKATRLVNTDQQNIIFKEHFLVLRAEIYRNFHAIAVTKVWLFFSNQCGIDHDRDASTFPSASTSPHHYYTRLEYIIEYIIFSIFVSLLLMLLPPPHLSWASICVCLDGARAMLTHASTQSIQCAFFLLS